MKKKLLLLLFLPFLITGCFDYNELNDLAIVSGVAIDYEDEEYTVTFEIISTKKEGETSGATSTYNVTAKGKTITEAFANNGNNMDKIPYYDHIEIVLISEDIAKNHLKEVSEYLIRSSKFRNEFYMAIASNCSAKDLISTTSKEKPIASTFLVDLLEHNNSTDSAAYYTPFTEILNSILTNGEDAIISAFTLKDEEIVLDGMGIFKDYELQDIFDTKEASIMNLLNNFNTQTVFFATSCDNDQKTVISIYDGSVKIEPNNQEVVVKATLNARINEDNCNHDLRDTTTYEELEKEFTKIIENQMDEVITKLKFYESNSLNIGKSYYNKYRQELYTLWTTQKFTYDINIKINKKGLIFEVNE